ncbi:MAG: DUF1592 domain-containing protein [Bryobacteraceae bacterium]
MRSGRKLTRDESSITILAILLWRPGRACSIRPFRSVHSSQRGVHRLTNELLPARPHWIAFAILCTASLPLYSAAPTAPPAALLRQYCYGCHSQKVRSGNLALEALDVTHVSQDPAVWEKVVRKLRAGVMPPIGLPRPEKREYDDLVSWLETELDRAGAAHPNPGRTEALHRLNRAEYRNAVRDLLGLEIDAAKLLPADDGSYGFDNIAGVLKMSPSLMERYLAAAGSISRLALGAPVKSPEAAIFRVSPALPQYDHVEGLPFGTRGGTLVRYNFPVDAEYEIKVELQRSGTSGGVSGLAEAHDMEISVAGEEVKRFALKPAGGRGAQRDDAGKKEADADLRFSLPVHAGPQDIGVAFLLKTHAEDTSMREPFRRTDNAGGNGVNLSQPHVAAVIITGPFAASSATSSAAPRTETPSRKLIFACHPGSPSEEDACASQILTKLGRRGYRRPVTDRDLAPLLAEYKTGREGGTFDSGIEMAVRRLLVSPEFLFRAERDPAGIAAHTNYRVSDLELASRLSFFLWSSIPDDELLGVATDGKLRDPRVFAAQVRRILADARAQAFVANFSGQWLYLRNVPAVTPNLDMFPDFDEGLRQDLRHETELFFGSIVSENRSALELLTADYTFLNERLARHYGIPNVYGSRFRRIPLGDLAPVRGGLLGQGSILTVTSHADRTSPVLRGKWILENILGTPPAPPPAVIPPLNENNRVGGKVLSMRERMSEHRSNPACAGCHKIIDPAGFALENFDAVGRWRDADNTPAVPWVRSEVTATIDASGVLPDGSKFNGPAELRQALLHDPSRFVTTLTTKLMTYALGRGVEYYDMPAIRAIVRDAAADDNHFQTLILGVAESQPFQMRRSPE